MSVLSRRKQGQIARRKRPLELTSRLRDSNPQSDVYDWRRVTPSPTLALFHRERVRVGAYRHFTFRKKELEHA